MMPRDDRSEYDEHAELEAYIEDRVLEFRLERGAEISDEHTKTEIVVEALRAHRQWWPRTAGSLEQAQRRLGDGEFAESIFHAGRAFDGYTRNVLTLPVQEAVLSRFSRSLPAGISVKRDSIFKSVAGVSGAAAFSEYAVSLLTSSTSAANSIISDMRHFIGGTKGGTAWSDRDRVFHAPVNVTERLARDFHFLARHILHRILGEIEPLLPDFNLQFELVEFSTARLEVLHSLALAYDVNPKTYHAADEIDLYDCSSGDQKQPALEKLTELGYVEERIFNADMAEEVRAYRMTKRGHEFYRDEIFRRLPDYRIDAPDLAYWNWRGLDNQSAYTMIKRSMPSSQETGAMQL